MKALVPPGDDDVRIDTAKDPELVDPTDVIVRTTTGGPTRGVPGRAATALLHVRGGAPPSCRWRAHRRDTMSHRGVP